MVDQGYCLIILAQCKVPSQLDTTLELLLLIDHQRIKGTQATSHYLDTWCLSFPVQPWLECVKLVQASCLPDSLKVIAWRQYPGEDIRTSLYLKKPSA